MCKVSSVRVAKTSEASLKARVHADLSVFEW